MNAIWLDAQTKKELKVIGLEFLAILLLMWLILQAGRPTLAAAVGLGGAVYLGVSAFKERPR